MYIRLASIPKVMNTNKERVYDSATGKYTEKTSRSEDPETKRQRQNLESDIRGIDRRIEGLRRDQGKLRTDINTLEAELAALKG